MCDQRLWSPLVSELQKQDDLPFDYHFLTIAELSTIDKIVNDINRQIHHHNIILVGFSLGGYLASAVAVKYPQLVKKLIVLSNLPCSLPTKEQEERARTLAWVKQRGYRGVPRQRILHLLDTSAYQRKDIIELITAMDKSLGEKVLVQQLSATTKRESLMSQLQAVACPKYFAVGENDNLVDVTKLQVAMNADEQMHLQVFTQTGHMLPLEQTEDLAAWLVTVCRDDHLGMA